MTVLRAIAGTLAVFCLSMSASYAGPCADDITRMEDQINRKLDAIAAAGPTGAQDATAYGKHLQPTPNTIATAEEKLRELSKGKFDAVKQFMDRARAADAAGDKAACEKALADAQRELGR